MHTEAVLLLWAFLTEHWRTAYVEFAPFLYSPVLSWPPIKQLGNEKHVAISQKSGTHSRRFRRPQV